MFYFWNFVRDEVKENGSCVLVVVAESSAASPGRQGFKMAVSKDGKIKGTIGGGVLEVKIIRKIEGFYEDEKKKVEIATYFHDENSEGERSGIICGGSQTIVMRKLNADDLAEIEKVLITYENGERKSLVISSDLFFVHDIYDFAGKYFFESNLGKFVYKEVIGKAETAYIIGGGHVGKEIAIALKRVGFYIVVIEKRAKLFTIDKDFPYDEHIITDFSKVAESIEEGEFSYVIIVTPKHIWDRDALKSVINLNVKYIGVMGSKKKLNMIYESLLSEGVDKNLFEKIHSPIGLKINSETPQEIAISVAAEIISVKNKR